jgi:asparagine synthase (glutamine-hydrolysing)
MVLSIGFHKNCVLYHFNIINFYLNGKKFYKMCGIFGILGYSSVYENILTSFQKLQSRGPDMSSIFMKDDVFIGFHRLAINDLSISGMQPFVYTENDETVIVACNGEIYNHSSLIETYNLNVTSSSDCAVIYPLFKALDHDFVRLNKELNGEYALAIIRIQKHDTIYYLSTDPLSVRPLFFGIEKDHLYFSSLQKGLLFTQSTRMKQGHFLEGSLKSGKHFYATYLYTLPHTMYSFEDDNLYYDIVSTFRFCVKKRIQNMDTNFACLLSGGLDSSLVSAIAQRYSNTPINTFTIGVEGSPDVLYAEKVAKHIGSNHKTIYIDLDDSVKYINEVIETLETYDITTIRASVGQYILAKHIANHTDIKVILNGDGADEVQMGYLYFFNAPSIDDADKEQQRLLSNIHLYDGLRVDRCIANSGLEARVPFLDYEFVFLYKSIEASLKVPSYKGIEKYLIRKAFEHVYKNEPILPADVLWRKKEAFSDGISKQENSWYSILQNHFNQLISDKEFEDHRYNYDVVPPTKEAYYYRKVYESLFPNQVHIKEYWMPKWSQTNDPSARTLTIYNSHFN